MTAIYIPPPPPGRSTASVSFSGELQITAHDNAGIMQKAFFMARAARVDAAWVSGVDGLNGEVTGATVIHFSDRPFDPQDGAAGFDLTLAGGQSQARVAGELTIPAGGWVYIFIVRSDGGHYGAQVGFEITWQE